MGRDLAAQSPSAKGWFNRANAALGYDLAKICFEGPEGELTRAENAQPEATCETDPAHGIILTDDYNPGFYDARNCEALRN